MNEFKSGLLKAGTGIVVGLLTNSLLNQFAESGLIPSNIIILFSLGMFVSSLLIVYSLKYSGAVFLFGWMFGAIFLMDLLDFFDFLLYIGAPIAALVIRGIMYMKE